MTFDVVHRDQRNSRSETEALGVSDTHQEGANQPGPDGNRNRRKIPQTSVPLIQGFPHDGHDRAKVLAGSQFGNYAAVLAVRDHLAGYDAGENAVTVFNHGGS